MNKEKCSCCGCPVTVEGKTTKYYSIVFEERIRRLREALELIDVELTSDYDSNWRTDKTPYISAAREALLADDKEWGSM